MLFLSKEWMTHLVLIVWNSYEGVHSGQIASLEEMGNRR
jgi:hypothetical protein